MLRLTNRIVMCLLYMGMQATSVCAQSSTSGVNASKPRDYRPYIAERLLLGNPQKQIEDLDRALISSPPRMVEILRKKALPEAVKLQISEAIKAKLIEHKVIPLTDTQAQAQYDIWGACIARAYPADFSPEKLSQLHSFIDSGLYLSFAKLREPLKDWLIIAMERQQGRGVALATPEALIELPKDQVRGARLSRLFETFLAITDSGASLLVIHNFLGASTYSALMAELLMMSEELPRIAAAQGISMQEWAAIEEYAHSGVANIEQTALEKCIEDQSNLTTPMKVHLQNIVMAVKDYFDQNPNLMAASQ